MTQAVGPAPAPAVARAESGEWARLHPLSPVVRFSRGLPAVIFVLGGRTLVNNGDHSSRLVDYVVDGVVLLIALIGGTTSWAVTRWRIRDGDLQVNSGLIRKQSLRLPLARMQAVDIVRPILARAFGLAELRVVVAGGGSGQGRLGYLREEQAEQVRAKLLAISHGVHEDTPAPTQERLLVQTDNGRLVASTLLGAPTVLLLLFVVAIIVVGVTAGADAAGGTAAGSVAVLLTLVQALGQRINSEFSQTVAESPDGLRIRGGLLQTRAETVPFPRLQALRWSEPILWRPFGWCRIELDVARQRNKGGDGSDNRDNGRVARALLPVGPHDDGVRLLQGFMPGVVAENAWRDLPPSRARFKAPFSYRHLGIWHDERVLLIGSGWFSRRAVVVPLHKIQSLRLVQGPWARALRLQTLHVDLVGRRWTTSARCRDATAAEELIGVLSDAARAARAKEREG